MKFLATLLLAMLAGNAGAGDIYRWVDDRGVIRYSDLMPPPDVKDVRKIKSSVASPSAENSPIPLPPESRVAAEKFPVALYSFEECGDICKKAEELLNKRGVPYTLKNTNDDKIALQKLTGKLEVPVMVIGDTAPVSGFEEELWNKKLDSAGYAKSNPNVKPGTSMAIKAAPAE